MLNVQRQREVDENGAKILSFATSVEGYLH